ANSLNRCQRVIPSTDVPAKIAFQKRKPQTKAGCICLEAAGRPRGLQKPSTENPPAHATVPPEVEDNASSHNDSRSCRGSKSASLGHKRAFRTAAAMRAIQMRACLPIDGDLAAARARDADHDGVLALVIGEHEIAVIGFA